jgi:hypothetical protein
MVGQLVSWSVGSWSVGVGQLVGWSVLMVSLVNCVVRFVFSVKFLITSVVLDFLYDFVSVCKIIFRLLLIITLKNILCPIHKLYKNKLLPSK